MTVYWSPTLGPETAGNRMRRELGARHRYPGKLTGGHWVLVHAWGSDLWTTFLLGPEGGRIVNGYADIEVTKRPRRKPLTEWNGLDILELEIDALYDTFTQPSIAPGQPRHSVEYELWKLEQLAERATEGNSTYQPTIKVFGPVPRADARWVLDDLEWGDCIRGTHFGNRLRQQVTLTLKEFGAAENIVQIPKQQTRKYKIAKGDDLQKIAKKMLGKAARWKDIEKLNKGMRGVKLNAKLFPVGKQILVPAK